MARIYLPQEDLERFGVTPEELGSACRWKNCVRCWRLRPRVPVSSTFPPGNFFLSLTRSANPRCGRWWRSIAASSTALNSGSYDVYSERVRLSLGDKLKILAKGFGKRLL